MNTFGENVKKWRRQKRFSQTQLARSIGVKQTTISKIECGRQEPTEAMVEKIAKSLCVRPSVLLGADEKPVGGFNAYQRKLIVMAVNFRIEEEISALAEGMGVQEADVRAVWEDREVVK